MNLIDEEFETKNKDNSKKITKLILAIIIILVIAIIGIFGTIVYIQGNTLKFYFNGVLNEKLKEMMVIEEDGTIYFPIKEVSSYFGYESYNGEYTEKSEEASKCYIKCSGEIANFALNSNKVYTLLTSQNSTNYDYFYASKPVKAINGKLYAPEDAIEKAFNISFSYDKNKKLIYVYTMPYLIEIYTTKILDYGYEKISDLYINQKTVLNSMLVVTKNDDKAYGVIDTAGNTIIEAKYDYIEYLPNSGDFLVKSNKKVGIISAKRETKIQLLYDDLHLIDKDNGLYLAKKDNKYGVIDSAGNIKIYIEYDQIGIDNSLFEKNDIKNKYLLSNGMIPVRKDKKWGTFDKNGRKVLNIEYDGFGYIATNNKDAINLLMIPDYNVIVARKGTKYTLINSVGKELCYPILDDVYMEISSGEKSYKMNYGEKIGANVKDFLDTVGEKPSTSTEENKTQNNTSVNEIKENVVVVEESNDIEETNTVETSAQETDSEAEVETSVTDREDSQESEEPEEIEE